MHRIHLLPKKMTHSTCQVSLVVKYLYCIMLVNLEIQYYLNEAILDLCVATYPCIVF